METTILYSIVDVVKVNPFIALKSIIYFLLSIGTIGLIASSIRESLAASRYLKASRIVEGERIARIGLRKF